MKKIVIAGGTGFLGQLLAKHFANQGYQVVIFSRSKNNPSTNISYIEWDGESIDNWKEELEGAEALINLCGKSVDCRYTDRNKQLIYDTRLKPTKVLGEAINACKRPPKLWINSSSATIYRHAEDREMDEKTGEYGNDFSVDVCQKWEKTFFDSANSQTRKIVLRIAIVLGKNGGALIPLKKMSKLGLGGKQGSGQQYFSWIHEQDFTNVIDFVMHNDSLEGVYNVSSPNPVKNDQVMGMLKKALKMPFGIPSSRWMLELGAWLIRTETELILKSRRVVPAKLSSKVFKFQYPYLEDALNQLIKQ